MLDHLARPYRPIDGKDMSDGLLLRQGHPRREAGIVALVARTTTVSVPPRWP